MIYCIQSFGEGPYRVLFNIEFPEDKSKLQDWKSLHPDKSESDAPGDLIGSHLLIVRLASLDLMPHSVNMFMHSVYAGLYNGVKFQAAPGHVIGTSISEDQQKTFDAHEKGYLAFPEYNENYPHKIWTLGFTNRPAGPGFYFNMVDNVQLHGPGGQSQYLLQDQADPCFADVIAGSDTLMRMDNREKSDEKGGILVNPVTLQSVRILNTDEYTDIW